jgi:glyoxylase-like metal-dependent hydrolase (beta-lactamase superfamily II)
VYFRESVPDYSFTCGFSKTCRNEADGIKKVTGLSDSDLVRMDSGDTLKIGDIEVEFLHTPGHTLGSQCFRI